MTNVCNKASGTPVTQAGNFTNGTCHLTLNGASVSSLWDDWSGGRSSAGPGCCFGVVLGTGDCPSGGKLYLCF